MENAYVAIADVKFNQHQSRIHLVYQLIINKTFPDWMEKNIIHFILIEDNFVQKLN